MITLKKLKEHLRYKGDGDLYVRTGGYIVTDAEWSLIDNLLQDWTIIKSGLASSHYISIFDKKLSDNFDSADTVTYFKSMKE